MLGPMASWTIMRWIYHDDIHLSWKMGSRHLRALQDLCRSVRRQTPERLLLRWSPIPMPNDITLLIPRQGQNHRCPGAIPVFEIPDRACQKWMEGSTNPLLFASALTC